MLTGTAYGVVLNDADEIGRLADTLNQDPYKQPPVAPVLYIKPRGCFLPSGGKVALDGRKEVTLAATLGLLFGRSAGEQAGDGVLPLGAFSGFSPAPLGGTISTSVDGAEAHAWPLSRHVRSAAVLIAEVSVRMPGLAPVEVDLVTEVAA